MQIFNAQQIREIDSFTIKHEAITTIQLISRVADALFNSLSKDITIEKTIAIIAGRGNNGSDALALAEILTSIGFKTTVFGYDAELCKSETKYFQERNNVLPICEFCNATAKHYDIIIDGLLGSGLSKPIEGIEKTIIETINNAQAIVYSIDIPSGLFTDQICTEDACIVKANYTLTLEFPKLSFMFPEHGNFIGELRILPIGLNKTNISNNETPYHFTQRDSIIINKRERFSHKGTFGHVMVVAGSIGTMGACVLTSKASLKIGAGLVTSHIPGIGNSIMQTAVPEVMVSIDNDQKHISSIVIQKKANVISIGPGIGTELITQKAIINLLRDTKTTLVIDADALNCIALQKAKRLIPEQSIITPHCKEFDRLFGPSVHSQARLNAQIENSKKYQIYIVLKGYRTSISTPDGELFFNSTGNPGMASAGSGDVLTGLIAGLLAQGYTAINAARIAVYIHGLAGDFAAKKLTENCVMASDLIQFIPEALLSLIND
jgi:NAD(P)H-hydrate epimerase